MSSTENTPDPKSRYYALDDEGHIAAVLIASDLSQAIDAAHWLGWTSAVWFEEVK